LAATGGFVRQKLMPIPTISGGDACACPSTPIKDFPPLIRNALARAAGCDAGGLGELNVQERNLLCRIVRNVSASSPTESIRVANETLAIALKVSDRTIRRIKARLEEKGWLSRSQIQSRRLGMQISDVWLSEKALHTLGLIGSSALQPAALQASSKHPSSAEIGLAAPLAVNQSHPKQTVFHDDVPVDLLELRDVAGLSVAGIRLLMGLATESGTRLGHVFAATRDLVLASRAPFAYLQKLIRSGKDWSQITIAAQASEQATAAEAIQADEQSQLIAAFKGRLFSHEKRLFVWSEFGGVLHQASIQNESKTDVASWRPVLDAVPLLEAWKAGKLFEINAKTLSEWRSAGLTPQKKGPPNPPQDISSSSNDLTQNFIEVVPNKPIGDLEPERQSAVTTTMNTSCDHSSSSQQDTVGIRVEPSPQPAMVSPFQPAASNGYPSTRAEANQLLIRFHSAETSAAWTLMSDAILEIPQSLQRQLIGPFEKNASKASQPALASTSRRLIEPKEQIARSTNRKVRMPNQTSACPRVRQTGQHEKNKSDLAMLDAICQQSRVSGLLAFAMGFEKQPSNTS
jgi:hypothetical protein